MKITRSIHNTGIPKGLNLLTLFFDMSYTELSLNLIFANVKSGITIRSSLDSFSLRSQVNTLFSDLNCRAIAFRKPFSEDLVFIGDDQYSQKEIVAILHSGAESLFVIGESKNSKWSTWVDSFFTMDSFEPVLEQKNMDSFIEYEISNSFVT